MMRQCNFCASYGLFYFYLFYYNRIRKLGLPNFSVFLAVSKRSPGDKFSLLMSCFAVVAFLFPQFYVMLLWMGFVFPGSRSGAIIAACWATMMHFGEMGYVESTRTIVSTTRFIVEE